ncbi:MAG TPA: MFS transporter [Actinomycetota bacterium]|nr:MFS transporter [Actinomycetota bacterium]
MKSAASEDRRTWLTSGVGGIGVASLLSDAGHEVPTSLLPSFLSSTLGAPAAALGLIEGLADGLAGVAKLAGGALADGPQRRRATAVGGYITTAVTSALIGVATAVWQVAVFRIAAWTARGLRVPSRNALLADAAPAESYGRAYGFERAMDNLGAIIGPLLAIVLVASVGLRTAILLSVIPGLLAVAAIIYAIRRLPRSQPRRHEAFRLRFREALSGGLRRVMLGIGAFELGNLAATLMILRATELLAPTRGLEPATSLALWLYVAYNAAAALASVPAGRAADRRGGVAVMIVGVALSGIAYIGLAVSGPLPWVLAVWFITAGVAIGCVETAENSTVALMAPDTARGSAFGLLAAAQSFGNLAASGVAGALWTVFSSTVAFGYAAAWMGVSAVALVIGPRR